MRKKGVNDWGDEKAKSLGLIAGACKACSNKMDTRDAVSAEGIELLDDVNGHPGMAHYLESGYQIITF